MANESKSISPGPWRAGKSLKYGMAIIYDADGNEVARICAPNSEANSRLIAAAHQLLDASMAALHYMRLHKYADQAWVDDIEAAIQLDLSSKADQ